MKLGSWLALWVAAQSTVFAAKFALVVGIGTFAAPPPGAAGGALRVPALDGPEFDAQAVALALSQDSAFDGRVTVLVNAAAKKAAILGAIRDTIAQMKPDDYFLVYVSTHGTSRFDPQSPAGRNPLGPETGALVPYDIQYGAPERVFNSLIVGTRDLRPLFLKVPEGAMAFVVFDSCYAGESARGIGNQLPARNASLPLSPAELEMMQDNPAPRPEPWPYSNVLYLAASSSREPARDIGRRFLSQFPTVDGDPHGAMTNSLLKGLKGEADTDRNASITHRELFQYIQRDVERNFPQKPQLQAPPNRGLEDTRVFAPRGSVNTSDVAFGDIKTRVLLEGAIPEAARRAIAGMDRVIVVSSGAYDLRVRKPANRPFEWLHPSGDVLGTFEEEHLEKMLTQLRYYWVAKGLIELRAPQQNFNVQLTVTRNGMPGFGEFPMQHKVGFTARADRDVPFALLLDIDPYGNVNLLHRGSLDAGQTMDAGSDITVIEPLGVEHIKFLAYGAKPDFWDRLKYGVNYPSSSPEVLDLLRLAKQTSSLSETAMRVVTVP